MNSFFQRATTAFFFVGIMIGSALFETSYVVLMALITAFCTQEYMDITSKLRTYERNFERFNRFGLTIINVGAFLLSASLITWQMSSKFLVVIPALLFLFFILELYSKSDRPLTNIALNLTGFIYVGLPFSLLNFVVFHTGSYNSGILIGILLLVWVYDAAAYIFGSLFGSRPLFKRISPNKTIEGSLAGLLVLTAFGFGLGYIFEALSPLQWAAISFIVAYFSAMGDLVESMIKRSLDIKDTGNIMPGHGGFLDRFDAFIFVIPFIALFLLCF